MENDDQKQKYRNVNPRLDQLPQNGMNWWTIILVLAVVWLIASYFFNSFEGEPRVNIAYSKLKKEVKDNNINRVLIQGDKINGSFKNKFIKVDKQGDSTSYKYFSTIKPSFQDPELMKLFESKNVTIKAEEKSDNTWMTYFLFLALPWIFIIGYFVYMRRKMSGSCTASPRRNSRRSTA